MRLESNLGTEAALSIAVLAPGKLTEEDPS